MTAVISLLAKATVVIVFALIAAWLARRQRASLRHLIWLAAFAVLALLPAGAAVMPSVPIHVPFPSTFTGVTRSTASTTVDVTQSGRVIRPGDSMTPAGDGSLETGASRTSPLSL